MKTRTKIFIVFMILLLIVGNYYIYIERIKYEIWETQDLIFFLGILNLSMICFPTFIFIGIDKDLEDKRRKELAILLVESMLKKHEEEVKDLKDTIKKLESEKEETKPKKRKKNKCIADNIQ